MPPDQDSPSKLAPPEESTDDAIRLKQVETLKQRILENSAPDGPIREELLPSLHAAIDVLVALISDGQREVAHEIMVPIAQEVDRIIARGY